MNRLAVGAKGSAKKQSTPTVWMTAGTGSADADGRFDLSWECCTEKEIDDVADLMRQEVEEWRVAAKRELRNRRIITEGAKS